MYIGSKNVKIHKMVIMIYILMFNFCLTWHSRFVNSLQIFSQNFGSLMMTFSYSKPFLAWSLDTFTHACRKISICAIDILSGCCKWDGVNHECKSAERDMYNCFKSMGVFRDSSNPVNTLKTMFDKMAIPWCMIHNSFMSCHQMKQCKQKVWYICWIFNLRWII